MLRLQERQEWDMIVDIERVLHRPRNDNSTHQEHQSAQDTLLEFVSVFRHEKFMTMGC